jgi:hypothetical protein
MFLAACFSLLAFSPGAFAGKKDPEIVAQIKALKELLKTATSNEEREAIKAQIKLLKASAKE